MNNTVIKVEDLGKLYKLGEISTGTLSHDMARWWARMRGKEDPFAKIGETNDRTARGHSDYVWALKDINFEVKQGEVLGIIGRNGAGKSTLLKILSKVTTQTTGRIKIKGRIASLLEVGTGFHPELTGRENIFLNGAILGMTKTEIRRKFDEIVDFSGVERYIDTPVKRYSSGMYVRLAFAVAGFLEPEILIVDEVLAVGDAEFQKKCLGRMKDVSVNDGRTVLFVSHSMSSLKNLCTNGIIMDKGQVINSGDINSAIQLYFNLLKEKASHHYINKDEAKKTRIREVFICDEEGKPIQTVTNDIKRVFLVFEIENWSNFNPRLGMTIFNSEGLPLLSSSITDSLEKLEVGIHRYKLELPISFFKSDEYNVEAALSDKNGRVESNDCYIKFKVEIRSKFELAGMGVRGLFLNPYAWEFKN